MNRPMMQQMQQMQQRVTAAPPELVIVELRNDVLSAKQQSTGKAEVDATTLPNVTRWMVVYPVYLDKKHTRAEGRRIASAIAVEKPAAAEIAEACLRLGFEDVALEPRKGYPRIWDEKGRVRIKMKDEDGLPVHGDLPSKKQLFPKIAELIPTLQSRTAPQKAQEQAAAAAAQPKQSTKVGKSKGKKKR